MSNLDCNFNGIASNNEQTGAGGNLAFHRINSYLHNTLDLRNLAALAAPPTQPHNSSNSIDSLWSDLVSGNTEANRNCLPPRTKAHSVNGLGNNSCDLHSLHLNQLLNGGSQAYSNNRSNPRTPQVSQSNGNGNIFNYQLTAPVQTKDDSTSSSGSSGVVAGAGNSSPSAGGMNSSLTSPSSHFSYASPPKVTRLSNTSDPGSPSLDDAIVMGIQNHRQQQQQSDLSNASEGVRLAELMGSLNLSSNSSATQRTLNCSNNPTNLSSLNSTLNTTLNNFSYPQTLDLTTLTQLQNSTGSYGSTQGRSFDHSMTGSLSNNSYSNNSYGNSTYHNGSSLMGVNSSGFSSSATALDVLTALERGTPLASFLSAQDPYSIEKAAKMHRTAAAVCEATCTWSGQLPVRIHKNPFYSCKVFLGGVPWDVTEAALRQTFVHFGNIQVEWPGKENSANPPKGYVYILFENEKQVKNLLAACSQDFNNDGNYYYKISSRRMRQKEVQVIPWVMSDSNYVRCPSYQLDAHKTVFIGALHGMLSAEALANIINDLFGGVVYAGIDTDKHKYPIGSGRITFNNLQSYRKAVRAAFVEIKTPKFTKKVQIDPYLADSLCQICGMQQGPYFCRDESCFKYFCRTCWLVTPNHQGTAGCHKPLMRNSKLRTQTRLNALV